MNMKFHSGREVLRGFKKSNKQLGFGKASIQFNIYVFVLRRSTISLNEMDDKPLDFIILKVFLHSCLSMPMNGATLFEAQISAKHTKFERSNEIVNKV